MLDGLQVVAEDRAIRLVIKPLVFTASLLPMALLVWSAATHQFNANPFNAIVRNTGDWSLRFLCLTLAITPWRWVTGWHSVVRFRRMLGLFGFSYALLHVSTYAALDQVLDWHAIWEDVTRRKFILVGFTAFVLLVPLAATSTRGALKRLGYARWKRLHRLAYVAPALGVMHFTWRVKKDMTEPAAYALVLGGLLLVRAGVYLRSRPSAPLQPE